MNYVLFAGNRIANAVPVLLGVVVVTFVLMRLLPGDPAAFFATSPNPTQEEMDQIRDLLGLDKPLHVQLWDYLSSVLAGDLGNSLLTGRSVSEDILSRIPASAELTFYAMLISLSLSLPMGVISALYQGSLFDHFVRVISTLGVSVPTFVTGLVLIYAFYFHLNVAPAPIDRIDVFVVPPPTVTGFLTFDALIDWNMEALYSSLAQLILPSLTMAIFVLSPLTRMTRASMIGTLSSDFVRTARSAGLSWWNLNIRYAFRNAFIPVLTTMGLIFSYMLGANILVERVFAWPGIGSYALNALTASDYAPVQGYVLVMGTIYVTINLTIDLVYGLIDPRLSVGR